MGEEVKLEEKLSKLLTEENVKTLDKTLRLLKKMDDLGILDSLSDALEPEVLAGLVKLVMSPCTLRLLDRLDLIFEILGRIDYEAIEKKVPLINEAVKAIPEKPKPVGLTGLLGALRDPEVQKGLGLVIEVLRKIGKYTSEKSKD